MIKWLLIVTNIDGSVSRDIRIECSKKVIKNCVHYYQRYWEKVQIYKLKEVKVK